MSWALVKQQWRSIRQTRSRLQSWTYISVLYCQLLFFKQPSAHTSHSTAINWFPHLSRQKSYVGNALRALLQSLYLVFVYQPPQRRPKPTKRTSYWRKLWQRLTRQNSAEALADHTSHSMSGGIWWFSNRIVIAIATAACLFALTLPMSAPQQGLLLLIFWAIALWMRKRPGNYASLVMMLLSIFTSTRYIYWRVTETVRWDVPLDATLGLLLLFAELYAWSILILGYTQTAWPLKRQVAKLPQDTSQWPTVDIYIPTYNEPLAVVRATVLAAKAIEWPEHKLNIYLLDDGGRHDFYSYCQQVGVHYLAREGNTHAKAGNLNAALQQTNGDYIAIFDCDHIPTRGFLQLTMGWFLQSPDLAMLQTPHHFFSPDPFERNLAIFRSRPNEGELFYGLIQDGNDMWNATFFCGSCAVIKRQPLLEVGGIAVETVTEDAHTALKMHRKGYQTAYLNIPLAAGLATENLADHIGQRMRWARGMAQIFRLDNPMLGKGLNLAQRLCYSNAMLYFLNGLPRLIFLMAPLAFLLLDSYIVFAPAVMIAAYALPHIIHANLTNSRKQGQFRHSFWAEMYETVLAWYIFKPTTMALINPHKGKFNVTAKGQQVGETFFDWRISTPYLILITLSILGFCFGIYKLFTVQNDDLLTVVLNLAWLSYNLIIIGGAVAVAEEAKQQRNAHRVAVDYPVTAFTTGEHAYAATLVDFSAKGLGLMFPGEVPVKVGEVIKVTLARGHQQSTFNCQVLSCRKHLVGTQLIFQDWREEQRFIQSTFGRIDAWVGWRAHAEEQPLASLREVIGYGSRGYRRVAAQVAPLLLPFFSVFSRYSHWLLSFLPQSPKPRYME